MKRLMQIILVFLILAIIFPVNANQHFYTFNEGSCVGIKQVFYFKNSISKKIGVYLTNNTNVKTNLPLSQELDIFKKSNSFIYENKFQLPTQNVLTLIAYKNDKNILCEISFHCDCFGQSCMNGIKIVGSDECNIDPTADDPMVIIFSKHD